VGVLIRGREMKINKAYFNLALCVLLMLVLIAPASAQDSPHELLFSDGTIHKVDVDSGVVTLLSDPESIAAAPAWSPDGTQVAFIDTPGGYYYGQYSLGVTDTAGRKQVGIADDLVWRSQVVWLASGDTLLYTTSSEYKGGDCIIKSVKVDGSEPHEIFRHPQKNCDASSVYPVLSPDNTQIFFAVDEQDNGKYFELDKMDLASGKVTALTHNHAANSSPQWSPAGTQIAFNSIQDSQREIYLMDADGDNVRRLTHRPGNDYAPRWLPDGKHLIFTSDQGGYNIFELDLATAVVNNLTNLKGLGAWNPAVSPDGTQIAYLTGVDPVAGADNIDIMTLDTGEVHELSGIGGASQLAWRPLPK
jgi:Tol biopolymer transport system component